MFAYGFGSILTTWGTTLDNTAYMIIYLLPAILAILGWGLIIAYSESSAVSGLATTLMVLGISVQLQPLLYSFWNNCFNSFGNKVSLGLTMESNTMVMCVSLMITLCSLSGRLGLVETFTTILCFNVGWPMNYNLLSYLFTKWNSNLGSIEVMDAIGTNYVYLYAGIFSLVVSLFLHLKAPPSNAPTGTRHSAFIGLIGTGFAFAASPFTGFPTLTTNASYESPLNVYFTLSASVIFTYVGAAIFGDFKVGVRESLIGVLSGAAIIGAVSGYINNIGACLAIGAFAGFFSGFWLRYVHPRFSLLKSIDPMGIIGPITINASIGAAIVAPALFGAYKNAGFKPAELKTAVNTQYSSTYYLGIFGATFALALGMGIITGIICYFTRDPTEDYQFTKLISNDFQLYDPQAPPTNTYGNDPHYSAGQLDNKAGQAI